MLREDVVSAAAAGRFAIHAVSTVDEAIELLTCWPAGERGADGSYPELTVNGRVERRLLSLATRAREFGMPSRSGPQQAHTGSFAEDG
jgi:hypothetical protein